MTESESRLALLKLDAALLYFDMTEGIDDELALTSVRTRLNILRALAGLEKEKGTLP